MAKKKIKAVCCSCIFALGSIFYGLSFVENPQKSTFSYCNYFSTSIVTLTNQDGQSAIVDLASETFTKNVMHRLGVKKVETLFVLQDNTIDIDVANALGVDVIIRSTDAEGFENEVVYQDDKWHLENGFCFRYHFEKKRLLGLEFLFEGQNIFILRDWKTSESALQTLGQEDFDFVILGDHKEYAKYFSCNIYANETGEFVDKSYEKDGNMAVKILGEKTNETLGGNSSGNLGGNSVEKPVENLVKNFEEISGAKNIVFQKNAKNAGKMHKNFVWRCLD